MTAFPFRAPRRLLPFLALVALLPVAACTGRATSEDAAFDVGASPSTTYAASETTTTAARFAAEQSGDAAPDLAAGDTGAVATVSLQTPTDLGRDIVFTADMTVAVPDVTAAGAEAIRSIQALGGIVFGQQSSSDPTPVTVLTFKVLPEDFQTALDRLAGLGEVRNQRVSADDVTDRVVDLQSRIATAEASVERLRGFLENATDVRTVADLENQLLERETSLEQLRGQLRTIQDAVSLATIVATFRENTMRPAVRVETTAYPGHEDAGLSCPGSGGLTVDRGGEVTMCFEIVNVGDTDLTGFQLRDPVIDVSTDDLLPVFGSMDQVLEPGESIVVAAEIVADRSWRTQTNVTALPVDSDGVVAEGRSVANTASIAITAIDPAGVPGFAEGLRRSVAALAVVGEALVYFVAIALPFAWIPLLVWWWWRRTRSRRTTDPEAADEEAPEPQEVG